MSKLAIGTGIILGFFLLVGLWFVGNYNSLISSRNQVDQAWGSVETQYQRRFDLIDNLVTSVKGAQKQELEVFSVIAEARKVYNNSSNTNDKTEAANIIETGISLIPRLQEAYPELKSNQQITTLMNDLRGTEDGILKVRDSYNKTVTNYNTNIQRFPKNLFARSFGFEKRSLFKAEAGSQKAPKVNL